MRPSGRMIDPISATHSVPPPIARKLARVNSDAGSPTDSTPHSPTEPEYKKRSTLRVPPRWLRIPEAVTYAGINRSRLFALIAEGAIVSASVKQNKTATRGIRLIDRLSLDRLLETLCLPQEQRLVAEATELDRQRETLEAEQAVLAKKQKQVTNDLAAVRGRRHGVLS
jgi:hypothetical protein